MEGEDKKLDFRLSPSISNFDQVYEKETENFYFYPLLFPNPNQIPSY